MSFFSPQRVVPRTSYFICSGLRTGSTLLCNTLAQTGIAGSPTEHFNVLPLAEKYRNEYLGIKNDTEVIRKIIAGSITPNGVFGTKIIHMQVGVILENIISEGKVPITSDGAMLAARFPNLHYIWLRRENCVRQAISLYRAQRNHVWYKFKGKIPPMHEQLYKPEEDPEFDFKKIQQCLQRSQFGENIWKDFFWRNKINPLSLTYEEMTNDLTGTINKILVYLDLPQVTTDVAPPMLRQADTKTDEWEERFRELEAAERSNKSRQKVTMESEFAFQNAGEQQAV